MEIAEERCESVVDHCFPFDVAEQSKILILDHKEVAKGTLGSLARFSGMAVDAFLD